MNTDLVKKHFDEHDHYARHLGIELTKISEDEGIAVMPFDQRHQNGMGNAHGGAIFALADMAFAACSNATGKYCVNAQSSISYLTPGKVGPLTATARPIRLGRRLVTYEVNVLDGANSLVATAIITGYILGGDLNK